jgi:hypothetical protein
MKLFLCLLPLGKEPLLPTDWETGRALGTRRWKERLPPSGITIKPVASHFTDWLSYHDSLLILLFIKNKYSYKSKIFKVNAITVNKKSN